MRELTLKGFLKKYLMYLGDTNTVNLEVLVHRVLPDKPRIAEPLYIYAAIMDRTGEVIGYMTDAVPNQRMTLGPGTAEYYLEEYLHLNEAFPTPGEFLKGLEGSDKRIPIRYLKIFNSYLVKKNRVVYDREYIARARKQIVKLKEKAQITNYRICKDLNLNHGNIGAFLKDGDPTKVSRETATRILRYVEDKSGLRKSA